MRLLKSIQLKIPDKFSGEQQDIGATGPQRRNIQLYHVEPIV
jgi:hypothetical protein